MQEYRPENVYDLKGKLIKATKFDADDEPFYRYGYNERNTVIERATYSYGSPGYCTTATTPSVTG